MKGVQKAIIPGILLSSLLLFFLNQFVYAEVNTHSFGEPQAQEEIEEQTGETDCRFNERYPEKVLPWCELIEEKAEQYDVDPLLVAAVMLMESGGQPEVISHSGAVGLLQIMPRDGLAAAFQCINGPCFANRPTIEELKDPEFNVNYGVRMLAGLIQRFGNLRDALKAYGPGDVDYWYADRVLGIFNDL